MRHFAPLTTDLIKKYDSQTPRYTSYPTALQFHENFGQPLFEEHAQRSNSSLLPKDLSIYVHIPFCRSLCYFCGCNKVVTQANNKKVNDYLERLLREIGYRARFINDDRRVTQIHFGGGTPNFLALDQISDILDQIATQFHLDLPKSLEIGIELDPRHTSPEEIEDLAKIGFNRFSIGVQDFSPEVQKAINREQDEAATLDVINAAKTVSGSVNVDLITGLPLQSVASFRRTLAKVIDTGVTRVAAYNFAYLPERIKAQRLINRSSLPVPKVRLQLAQLARELLQQSDYQHIGMDHYALPDDPLAIAQANNTLQRNFQGYTTHRETDLIGIGASAISKFDTAYSQNETQLSLYSEIVDTGCLPIAKGVALTDDDRICAEVIQQIMCRNSVDLSPSINRYIERDSDVTLLDYFKDEFSQLQSFADDGLLILRDSGFDITELGRHFMRPIAAVFDRYLRSPNVNSPTLVPPISRTI